MDTGDPEIDPRLEVVQELWSTYREHGPEVAIKLLDADVEFVDHLARRFHGHAGVRRFFAEFRERGEQFSAAPFSFERHDGELLVVGHRRIRGTDGTRDDYLYFVHTVRHGRVCRIAAHRSREAALEDIAARSAR